MKIAQLVVVGTFLAMFALKVAGLTEMSWWLVTAPLWSYAGFLFFVFAVIGGCVVGIKMIEERGKKLK